MTFADTSRVALGLVEESTWATWPGGSLEEIRYSSESFGMQQDTTISNEVRSDQQVPDIIRTGISAQGGYSGEISYGVTSFEKALKGLLGAASDFSSPPTALEGEIQAVASGNQFQSDSTGAGVDFSGISVGDWVRASGFTDSANNGYFQVTAVDTATASAHTITVVGDALVDEAAAAGRSIQGSAALRNGTTKHSFSFEKQFLDLNSGSGLAARVLGYRVGGLQLTLDPQSIATFQFSGQGKQVSDTAGTDLSNESASLDFTTLATLTDAAANDVMSTTDGIGELIINRDSPFDTVTLQNLSANPQRNLRQQQGLQSGLGPVGIGTGRFTVSGSLQAYFEDKTLLEEYLLFKETDIAVVVKDGDGNAYLWDFPAIKFGGDGLPKGAGNDQDAVVALDFDAKRSTRDSQDYSMAVHKFASTS